jgi:hypothetical protein
MRVNGIHMAGSIPDLRGQIAALVSGTIPLDRFMDWYFANWSTIEFEGSDKGVELLGALRTYPLVRQELQPRGAVAA